MFDQLFHYPRVLARHQNAPMLIEREQLSMATFLDGDSVSGGQVS
jgi:hypothetical protein